MISTKLRRVLIVLCTVVIAVCTAWIICDQVAISNQQAADAQVLQLKPGASNGYWFSNLFLVHASAEEAEERLEQPDISTDFESLLESNQDVVAWLTAGERIDEPVVQRDNEYYLKHNLYGQYDSNGVVFLNEANSIWPRDKVLLVHGHNMRNKSRFGTLCDFESLSYVKKYPIVNFRTIYDDADAYYVPIAGFAATMLKHQSHYFDLMRVGFESDEQFAEYINEVRSLSVWQSPVDCTTEDDLLILITCHYQYDDGRFMLVCRKLRADETPEAVAALFNP